jgi:hypothetical protein
LSEREKGKRKYCEVYCSRDGKKIEKETKLREIRKKNVEEY